MTAYLHWNLIFRDDDVEETRILLRSYDAVAMISVQADSLGFALLRPASSALRHTLLVCSLFVERAQIEGSV
jgi:hypothetical protein